MLLVVLLAVLPVHAKEGKPLVTAVDWPQYTSNPFVVKLDIRPMEDSGGSLIAADLDGDGLMDYLITRPGHVAAYSHSGKLLWHLQKDIQVGGSSESEGLPGHHGPGVQAGDVDGDGKVEVVYLAKDGSINVVEGASGKEKLRRVLKSPAGSERWEHVIIANFRGKGDRDLLLQATNKSGYRMGKYMAAYPADKLDGKPLWETDKYVGCAHTGARIADIDGDGKDEVLGATVIDDDGTLTSPVPLKGHLDSIFVYNFLPDRPGLEVVALEEGGPQRVFAFNKDKVIWESHYQHQEPQNAAVGDFDPIRPGLEIWCRTRYNEHQKPFTLDAQGNLVSTYEMDKVAPEGWTISGVEAIWTIDWTGEARQLVAAKERHKSGDVCVFDPITGRFLHHIKEKADRLYVADVSGDWREELLVVSGSELRIYHNPDKNPNPKHPRLWAQNHYRRSKMTWNYYSP